MSIRPVALGATCLLMLAAPPAVLASSHSSKPTGRQIRSAVRRAKRSRELWATVNICNTRRHPHTLGIRGQMPGLGFAAHLFMNIQVNYWLQAKKKFVPDPNVNTRLSLGSHTHGRQQAGFTWQFDPPALLSGTVTFEWRLGRKVIGKATRHTTHGIKRVDDSDPKGYSAATCRILK